MIAEHTYDPLFPSIYNSTCICGLARDYCLRETELRKRFEQSNMRIMKIELSVLAVALLALAVGVYFW